MTIIILSIATVFNLIVLRWKYNRERYADMAVDVALLTILSIVFSGTITGLAIATTVSAILSTYLIFYPPEFNHEAA